jgi:hypothetical protein
MSVSHQSLPPSDEGDLGFTYGIRKSGEVELMHQGRLASVLRGKAAQDFLGQIETEEFAAGQQLMARLTGNYKRGNERMASRHPRNR